MFRNYFVTAWRNMWKRKVFSFINLGGLSMGLAAVMLIGIYIQTELSYDEFQVNGPGIYRVGFRSWQKGQMTGDAAEFTAPFGPDAKESFPEINSFCRISSEHETYFSFSGKSLKTSSLRYADSSFCSMFSFRLLSGNPHSALQNPYSIVLSQNIADKLFGNAEPVGQTITLDGKTSCMVTGIIQNAPANSTIKYDALVSMATLYHDTTYFMDWNGGWQYSTFLRLNQKANKAGLEKKFVDFMQNNFNEKYAAGGRTEAYLQPFLKIHLYHSDASENIRTNLYVFGCVAILILIISCINYINLSVGQASARFKEIGVRKVLGAGQAQLVKQFLGESFLITFCAFLFAIVLTAILFPLYQHISVNELTIDKMVISRLLLMIVAVIIVISLAAGGYLAFYLSTQNVLRVLKMNLPKSGKQILGKSLIVLQFAITTTIMTVALVVSLQLKYIKNKSLGFDKKHTVVLPLTGDIAQDKAMLLKQQISGLGQVKIVTAVSEIPYNNITQNGFRPEGSDRYLTIHQLDADEDFLKTMNIQLVAGNYFSQQRTTDADGYIINQALARKLNWSNPLNKIISRNGDHRVIGVVSDFHFASLHDEIQPLIITNKPWMNRYAYLAIKYNAENPSLLVKQVEEIWSRHNAGLPFDYWFLDTAYDSLYKAEERFQQLFLYFSLLSVMLSLAGVFSLVLLRIKHKTKEIGIRKVLGAGIKDIVQLTVRNYVYLIVTASMLSIPVTFIYTNKWLENFEYRIELRGWMFMVAGILTLLVTGLVLGYQIFKAAIANPVNSLRTE